MAKWFKGVIAEVAPQHCPEPVRKIIEEVRTAAKQLALF